MPCSVHTVFTDHDYARKNCNATSVSPKARMVAAQPAHERN
jgi:hypothetical protein